MPAANLNTLLFALEQLARPGWLVIEDIHLHQTANWYPVWQIFQAAAGGGGSAGGQGGGVGGGGVGEGVRYQTLLVRDRVQHLFLVHKY